MAHVVTKDREYTLIDDGTLDTVVRVHCQECTCFWNVRFSTETAMEYRDSRTGAMVRFNDFIDEWLDDEPCPICDTEA
jgi:hypothetical protein